MPRLKRHWDPFVGGYTYDGKTLTECQCNTSGGGCKCGRLESDKAREIERLTGVAHDGKFAIEVLSIPKTGKWIFDHMLDCIFFVRSGQQYGKVAREESDKQGWTIVTRTRNEKTVRGATLMALRKSIELVKQGKKDDTAKVD
jgi:hypothetical protein